MQLTETCSSTFQVQDFGLEQELPCPGDTWGGWDKRIQTEQIIAAACCAVGAKPEWRSGEQDWG
jgi:hypothetical protein